MAAIRDTAVAFGERALTNDDLGVLFPNADIARLASKTGIVSRRIAAANQTAADLATDACRELLGRHEPSGIDALVYVTQSPEYHLPSTSCILQERLGLRNKTACFDINLGCSGYVYGLAVASGLVDAGIVSRLLLVTSDTYSKFLDPTNLQTRMLFGDGASATLIESTGGGIGPFALYSDGTGAPLLRCPQSPLSAPSDQPRGTTPDNAPHLFMDGAGIFTFTLREIPSSVEAFLDAHNRSFADYDHVVFHQANEFVIDQLASRLRIPDEKVVRHYRDIGNTVSTSIPAAMHLRKDRASEPGRWLLIGFGVGLSWAVCEIEY